MDGDNIKRRLVSERREQRRREKAHRSQLPVIWNARGSSNPTRQNKIRPIDDVEIKLDAVHTMRSQSELAFIGGGKDPHLFQIYTMCWWFAVTDTLSHANLFLSFD